ncbi:MULTISPECIES: LapA family protein [unclassified Nocardioides]|uniref:LapA family protein n=1 Tax=unclassified Nocardioides TaxID=2615069 RepID=UPI003608D46C
MTEQTPEPEVTEPTPRPKDPLRRSRTSGAWTAVIIAAVLLVLLVTFIAQNTDDVHISFLGWDGTVPLAVALLIASAAGVVITAVVGTLRIWQLRRRVRRDRT